MNKKIIRDELQWLLEAINEQFETIRKYEEKIPHIEFDILMDNIRKFYEDMRMLQRLNEPQSDTGKKVRDPESSAHPVQGPDHPTIKPVAPAQPKQDTSPEITVRFDPPIPPPEKQPVPPVTPPGSPRKDIPTQGRKHNKPVEPDLFASEEPVFNIKLKEAREKTFGPKPASSSDNLKSAITINDKFMFINELFDGNFREYNETVETLNGFKNLNQASEFLDLMVKKNFWDTGSNAFKKLKELLERRF
ncbi:MAG: hypothetical protein M0P58_04110 [Bacteroidales bacterium]|jgi:hypothetical protein|nr:hypothetical protein [Bacteroidales bacterium]